MQFLLKLKLGFSIYRYCVRQHWTAMRKAASVCVRQYLHHIRNANYYCQPSWFMDLIISTEKFGKRLEYNEPVVLIVI